MSTLAILVKLWLMMYYCPPELMTEHTTNVPGGLETDVSSVDWVIDQYFEDYRQVATNGDLKIFESYTDQGEKLDHVIGRLGMRGPDGKPDEARLYDGMTLRALHAVRWIEYKMKALESGQWIGYDMYPALDDYWGGVEAATEAYLDQLVTANYVDTAERCKEEERTYEAATRTEWRPLYRIGDCTISKCTTPAFTRYVVKKGYQD